MKKIFFALIFTLSFQAIAHGPGSTGGSGIGLGDQVQAAGVEALSVGSIFKDASSSSKTLTHGHQSQSKALVDTVPRIEGCDELNTEVCDIIAVDPADHLKFGISFINFRTQQTNKLSTTSKHCDCLKKKLQGYRTDEDFAEAKKKERENVTRKILKSYGKKFVNQFAANLEDMSFFLNQTRDMFSSRGTGIDLQCMDQDRFSNKVKEVCDKKNITDVNFIENRKDLFINAVSGEITPFQYQMPAMANEILSATKSTDFDKRNTGSATAANASTLSRFQYDQMRMDLAIRDPEAKFMDKLLGGLMKHPEFSKQITEGVETGLSPVEVFMNIIGKNIESTNSFAELVPAEESKIYLKNAEELENSLKFIMMVHPGIGLALSDNKAFENVRKIMKPGSNETFFNTLNNSKNVLEPVLIDRCNNMIEEFATAVCTKDEEVIASVDPDDLQLLLYNTQDKAVMFPTMKGTHLNELLICEARVIRQTMSSATSFAGVGNLIDGRSVRDSDYIGNKGQHGGKGSNRSLINQFNFLASKSPDARKEMGEMIDRNNQRRQGFSGPGIAVNRVYAEEVLNGNAMGLGKSSMSKDEARKYIADSKKWTEKRSAEIAGSSSIQKTTVSQVASNEVTEKPLQGTQVPQVSAQSQNFVAPQTTSMIAPNYSSAQTTNAKQAEQSREFLRQYLAEKNDTAVSNKAVSSLDDSSAQELSRLRSEKRSLLEKELKDGEVRLKELESKLTDAAAKVPPAVVNRKVAVADREEADSESEKSSGRNPGFVNQRASNASEFIKGPVAGNAFSGNPLPGSTVPSAKAKNDVVTTESQVTSSPASQTDSGSIVISSTGIKLSESLPERELNQEVQKYLADSDLSSTSIEDIKSKGIKIRYNVMENDKLVQKEIIVKYENLDMATRNQIDFKLAHKNVQNQVSKLSVLRMLIKQNKTL